MAFNFLHPPPHFDSIIENVENEGVQNIQANTPVQNISPKMKASGNYQKYFTNINSTIGAIYKSITYTSASTSMQRPGKVLQVPVYSTTAEVNSIQNPVNGMIIYDTEADMFKFREGGTWVVK